MPLSGAIVGIGEVLWDLLPRGPVIGGAPFNFAFHCHQLGHPAAMVSRVGRDELGDRLRKTVNQAGLPSDLIQEDAEYPTGTVSVVLGSDGQPRYTIAENVAYDHLVAKPSWDALFGQAVAVCFGTLAQRDAPARTAIRRALELARNALVIFDVNLRQDYYSRAIVEESLCACRWAKLNEDELITLAELLQLKGKTTTTMLRELRRRFDIELACLTRGEKGCLLQTADEEILVTGVPVKVVDTVGAGDAFTAGLLVASLEGRPLVEAAGFANRLAARVAGASGGTPRISRAELMD